MVGRGAEAASLLLGLRPRVAWFVALLSGLAALRFARAGGGGPVALDLTLDPLAQVSPRAVVLKSLGANRMDPNRRQRPKIRNHLCTKPGALDTIVPEVVESELSITVRGRASRMPASGISGTEVVMAEPIRKKRLAGTIRRHLSEEFAREVADPRLAALSIQEVEVTDDLSIAQVKVRLMFGGEEESTRQSAMQTLSRIAPGLRASMSPVLRMRRVPELRFIYDQGADRRAEIDHVLDEIKREDAQKRELLGISDDSDELS